MLSSLTQLAFDRSLRSKDVYGRLRVESSNITKAAVNPYYGREIPGYQGLGLISDKVYQLLRHPDELKKAAPTFDNLPVLLYHVAVSANTPHQEVVVGTTGTGTTFSDGYLKTPLAVWTSEAIKLVESKKQEELSSSYGYDPDMTPGVYEGQAYDGVMRNIVGNHVALVERGRAGPDVVVSDKNPFEEVSMRNVNLFARLKDFLRQDADLLALDTALDTLDEKKTTSDKPVGLTSEEVFQIAKDAATAATQGMVSKPDLEAAVTKAKSEAKAAYTAREEVRSLVGEVALDSAEEIYKFALGKLGVKVEGVEPSAYSAMFSTYVSAKEQTGAPPRLAADSATRLATVTAFPDAKRIRQL